ncbi:MAG: DUF1801 domain-containing protein [Armatimonadetes bacterium]|nr:MAG: DUF1801 domain-containing protein [Armatimonadota bacterium]
MQSDARSVEEYLAQLSDDRREAIETVRDVIVANLPEGYVETMNWGMISYEIPLSSYPDTYNGKPLMYAALASQKNHMAVYLSGVYSDDGTRDAFLDTYRATGKKLDMGKSCVRFKKLDDLPVDLIGDTIASLSPDDFIEVYEMAKGIR